MFRTVLVLCLLPVTALATSFSGPSFDGGFVLPVDGSGRFGGVPFVDCGNGNRFTPSFPSTTGTPLAPETRDDMLNVLTTLPESGDMTEEEAKEALERMMDNFKNPSKPIFVDPKTGKPILAADLKPKGPKKPGQPGDRPDALSGCVTRSKTVCTGSGKERSCETIEWEVCVSSD